MQKNIEDIYVKNAYDLIANEFSNTRYRPWSCVESFLNKILSGSIVGDIGCGNGKNMYRTDCNFEGCDISKNLVDICIEKGLRVREGNVLNLPFEDNSFDHVICIAVLHHIYSEVERKKAIKELQRVTKKGGQIMILVWAFEQDQTSKKKFSEQDVLIPWRNKQRVIMSERYYHLFRKNELESLVDDQTIILHSFYEMSNWGMILSK